jgi:two-component system, cell cycle response regulator
MGTSELPTYLLASHEPQLRKSLEAVLASFGARVKVVLSAQAALEAMKSEDAPKLALLDAHLPGMEMSQLLNQARMLPKGRTFPIVPILDTLTDAWVERLRAGLVDDVLLRSAETRFWQVRIELAMRAHWQARQLEALRDETTEKARRDPLTGAYNREAMLSLLFRETDRAQRMKSSLCLVLFYIDDLSHWGSRQGMAVCDELQMRVAARVARQLRSYDILGRPGKDQFLAALPGCSRENAVLFAERLLAETFGAPFRLGDESVRLTACFGIAFSQGRSPVVVLREAEEALKRARDAGPESIRCFSDESSALAPVVYLSPASRQEVAVI